MQTRKKFFTLFELLISLALLVIISVVALRMLVMTGDLWNYSHEQSDVYLDNKVVFNMLGEELSGIVYNYDNYNNSDAFFAPMFIDSSSSNGTALCFVTHTKRGYDSTDSDLNSDICKVAYIYLSPRMAGASGSALYSELNEDNVFSPENGVLLRIVMSEKDTDFNGNQSVNSFYNTGYYDFDLSDAQQVVEGVINFKVIPYKYDAFGNKLEEITSNDTSKGVTDVCAIRVIMTLLPPERCEDFRKNLHNADADIQMDFLQKYARSFSRTFWISPLNNQN